jgi:hypothetical protein
MPRPPAYVTKRLPVLYTIHPIVRAPGLPTLVTVDVAVVIRGIPSLLASHTVPEEKLDGIVASLQGGDVRVSVTGVVGEAAAGRPMAYVGVVCADGRRITVSRVRGEFSENSEQLAWTIRERIEKGEPLPGEVHPAGGLTPDEGSDAGPLPEEDPEG